VSLSGRVRETVRKTGHAVRAAGRVRDARAVLVVTGLAYLLAYLWAIGHLRPGVGAVELLVVADPLSRMVQTLGFLSFEPVARVDLWVVRLLVAPVNLLFGVALGGLVGLNLAVSYLAWRHPAACGIRSSNRTGILAGIPALLSGAACCGPVVLVAVGVQATGLVLATFEALVPIALLLLVGSLLYVGRSVDPTLANRDEATPTGTGAGTGQ
jgi:hypothetical protein